eukprot:SM000394S14738  [mRNA]  locus=s394:38509:39780:+ [translate_table: standard]
MSPPRDCASSELMARAGLRASGMPGHSLLRISCWNPARLLLGVVKALSPGDSLMESGERLPGIIEVLSVEIPWAENNVEIPLVEKNQQSLADVGEATNSTKPSLHTAQTSPGFFEPPTAVLTKADQRLVNDLGLHNLVELWDQFPR